MMSLELAQAILAERRREVDAALRVHALLGSKREVKTGSDRGIAPRRLAQAR
jgi:hypothetical protein